MKKNLALRDGLIATGIIAAILAVAAFVIYGIVAGNNIAPSMSDTLDTIAKCSVQIVLIAAALVAVIVITAISANMKSGQKVMVRGQSIIAGFLVVLLAANWICYGPLEALIAVTFTDRYKMSDETAAAGESLNMELCNEGIVLLKNDDNALPLNGVTNLNVFGWGSVDPVYGGSGSGAGGEVEYVSMLDGLEHAGFSINTELSDFYKNYNSTRPIGNGVGANNFTLPEPTVDSYPSELLNNAKAFSDTALLVFCRQGGENLDLPRDAVGAIADGTIEYNTTDAGMAHEGDFVSGMHYLELTNTERDLLDMVCSEFSNVVVIINAANPMELGFLEEYSSIKSALLVPGVGVNGFNSLGDVLSGKVNPSGRTADTFVYDLTDTPTFNNFGLFEYNNISDLMYVDETNENVGGAGMSLNESMYFVNYVEGIYVGYKFYETASDEGLIDYNDKVQFPFGHGLSYTTFKQEITNFQDNNGTITMDVAVTNTGSKAGKDVVEVYYTPPYYNGGIEKASVNLLDFGKTDVLEPGATATISFSFTYDDLASYDAYVNGCYVTEHGDYEISIRSNSHTVLDNETFTISKDHIYNDQNDGARDSDGVAAENVFAYAEGEVTYLSRKDSFANYAQATAAPAADAYSMTQEQKNTLVNLKTWVGKDHNDPNDVMPTMGAKNGLTFYDMKGVAYDDPKWDTLLDQMTFEEMAALVGVGGYQTAAVDSIKLPASAQSDGPTCISANFSPNIESGTSFCCVTMIAQTWNKNLAYERGAMTGKDANDMHLTGWYGPGADTHRSAFCGRNFEYYSEDGVLAGYMCANEVQGARDFGLLAYMKHFALNDQETKRDGNLMTWANEQSIREIYLKPFEIAVKKGNAMATMTSFNFIGNKWAGGYDGLLQTVLRDEWGFEGVVVTDWYNGYRSGYMDVNLATRSGGDQMLSLTGTGGAIVTDTSATATIALRKSCHNILYGLAQTNLMNWDSNGAGWSRMLTRINIGAAVVIIAAEALLIFIYTKKRKNEG